MTTGTATMPTNTSPERQPKPKRRKLRWVLLGGAIAVFGCLLATTMLALWIQAPAKSDADMPPPIPSPNGYDDLLRAYKALKDEMPVAKGQLPDYAKFETPALKEFVAKIHEPLAQIRDGLDRPFQVPYVYDLNVIMATTMRDVGQIKGFVNRALIAEGELARREKRTADAARSALDLIRVGNALGHEVPMGLYYSSLPSLYVGTDALRQMRAELLDDPVLCRKTITSLARLDRARPPVDRAIQREMAFMNINVRSYGLLASAAFAASGTLAKEKARAADSLHTANKRSEVFPRLLLVDLAILLYQKENQGAPPANLEALVPAILPAVPLDPYTDKPLIYRVVKDGYQLYSAGPDRDDDKLAPTLSKRYADKDDGDVTLDSL
jgi:hypothetical protein